MSRCVGTHRESVTASYCRDVATATVTTLGPSDPTAPASSAQTLTSHPSRSLGRRFILFMRKNVFLWRSVISVLSLSRHNFNLHINSLQKILNFSEKKTWETRLGVGQGAGASLLIYLI